MQDWLLSLWINTVAARRISKSSLSASSSPTYGLAESIKKLFKFNSMIFLKHLNSIFFFFSQLQWNPISFADVSLARHNEQARSTLALRNAAQSKRRKTCSFMSIINFINQI
jgi:hypothetical protein